MASPIIYFLMIFLFSYVIVNFFVQNYSIVGENFEEIIGGFAKGFGKRHLSTTTTAVTTTATATSITTTSTATTTTVPNSTTTTIQTAQNNVGVNYLTLYHLYDTSEQVLDRDFSRFKNDGINTIVIVIFWYRVESSPGVYNQNFINDVIRVSNVANKYGIKVMIDFHTLIGDSDKWSNPTYVGSGMNLITNATIANNYVFMVKWAVTQLKSLPNVQSYSVINEPWYWPLDETSKTNWINLAVNLSKIVKSIDNKPVTIRFVAPLFERDWNWDLRLLDAIDFISLNAYISEDAVHEIYWQTWDEYNNGIKDLNQKASAYGKKIEITEFGYSTDDTQQAKYYQNYTETFKSTTPSLMGWLNWGWDAGYDPNNPTFTQIGYYSIANRITGVPRPAYNVLVQSIY